MLHTTERAIVVSVTSLSRPMELALQVCNAYKEAL